MVTIVSTLRATASEYAQLAAYLQAQGVPPTVAMDPIGWTITTQYNGSISTVDGQLRIQAAAVMPTEVATMPAGVIVMWSGPTANIPTGWLLCNGQNGTPDLRDKFIKGTGTAPGATGGSATHAHAGHAAHNVTQPAAHTGVMNHLHPVTDPGHTHLTQRYPTATGASSGFTIDTSMSGTPTNNTLPTASGSTGVITQNPAGGVASLTHSAAAVDAHSAHDSVSSEPAWYALAFIQKE